MIGSDEISIAASKDYTLHINDAGELKATKIALGGTGSDLRFDDLKNRFGTDWKGNGDVIPRVSEYIVPVERGLGEAWELVD